MQTDLVEDFWGKIEEGLKIINPNLVIFTRIRKCGHVGVRCARKCNQSRCRETESNTSPHFNGDMSHNIRGH